MRERVDILVGNKVVSVVGAVVFGLADVAECFFKCTVAHLVVTVLHELVAVADTVLRLCKVLLQLFVASVASKHLAVFDADGVVFTVQGGFVVHACSMA